MLAELLRSEGDAVWAADDGLRHDRSRATESGSIGPILKAVEASVLFRALRRCRPEADLAVAQVARRPVRVTFHPEFLYASWLRSRVAGSLPLARNPVERIALGF